MKDVLGILSSLHRPRLLIRAARLGSMEYRRRSCLPRLLGYGALPRAGAALMRLIEIEHDLNESRINDDATYSVTRHVEVLMAMMGEAQLLRANQQSAGKPALSSVT